MKSIKKDNSMKQLLIILTLLCVACNTSEAPLIVTGVSDSDSDKKYQIWVNREFYITTDSLYSVGDTIQ